MYKFIQNLVTVSNNSLLFKLSLSSGTNLTDHLNEALNILNHYDIYKNNILPCYHREYESKFNKIKIVIDITLSTKHDVYSKLSEWREYCQVYTDGAKSEYKAAMALYDLTARVGHGVKLPDITSIYTAEVCAILAALDYVEHKVQSNPNSMNWIILIDNMSY